VECQEVLCRWLAGDEVRPIGWVTGLHRKTASKFVTMAPGEVGKLLWLRR